MLINILAGFFCSPAWFFSGRCCGNHADARFLFPAPSCRQTGHLGYLCMVAGLVIYNLHHLSFGMVLLSVKMFLIVFFVFLASPTATHSIVDAGMRAGLRPWTKKKEKE